VVNPAITYGAYQRLKDVIYPGKTNLRAHEAFRECSPYPWITKGNVRLTTTS